MRSHLVVNCVSVLFLRLRFFCYEGLYDRANGEATLGKKSGLNFFSGLFDFVKVATCLFFLHRRDVFRKTRGLHKGLRFLTGLHHSLAPIHAFLLRVCYTILVKQKNTKV